MIEVFSYSREQVKKIDLVKTRHKVWIRLVSPDPEKIKLLSENTGIPFEELEESLEEEERPKVSVKNYLEIIFRAPYVIDSELETLPVYFYIFENKIVTIEKKPLSILDDISKNLSLNKNRFLFRKGFSYFAYWVMDSINDDFLHRIDKIAARVDIYEKFSRKELTVKDIEQIYDQSVTLSFFNQAILANIEVLNTLKKSYFKQIPKKNKLLFEELYYDALQVLDTEKIQREALANLINVHSIITSARLNDFMKRLTTIALVFSIPTMISGILGMNFKYIPFSEHIYGFYIMVIMIFLFTGGVFYFFKKTKWF